MPVYGPVSLGGLESARALEDFTPGVFMKVAPDREGAEVPSLSYSFASVPYSHAGGVGRLAAGETGSRTACASGGSTYTAQVSAPDAPAVA
jgi:hypothetical protein